VPPGAFFERIKSADETFGRDGACGGVLFRVGRPRAQLVKATPELIDKDVKAVKAGGNARTFAVKRLGNYEAPLAERQAEVAELLMKLVNDSKSYNAIRSLSVWAREEELKALKELLGTGATSKAVVFVYSKKKYPPAAKELAGFLEGGGGERKDLVEALILIGAPAEEHVIPYLSSKKKEAVKHAVEVVARAGTRKSLEPLARVVKDYEKKDANVASAAKNAIGKIEEREKKGK
jgi:HEAT repeat protein